MVSINLPCALVFHFYWLLFNLVKGNLFLSIESLPFLLLAGAKLPLEIVFKGGKQKIKETKTQNTDMTESQELSVFSTLVLAAACSSFRGLSG